METWIHLYRYMKHLYRYMNTFLWKYVYISIDKLIWFRYSAGLDKPSWHWCYYAKLMECYAYVMSCYKQKYLYLMWNNILFSLSHTTPLPLIPSTALSLFLSLCLHFSRCLCLCMYLSLSLSVCVYVSPSVYVSLSLSLSLSSWLPKGSSVSWKFRWVSSKPYNG